MRRLMSVLLLGGVLLAGCGKGTSDDGIATAGGPGGATPSPTAVDNAEQGRKFAQCMRDHGIQMEDPEVGEGGEFKVSIGGPAGGKEGGGEMDKSKVDKAMEACKQYMPNGGEPRKMDPEQLEQARKMAACMRENGVPNFPDPSEDGGIRIDGNTIGDKDALEKAMEKCRQFGPKMMERTK